MKKLFQYLVLALALMTPKVTSAVYVHLDDGVYQNGPSLYIASNVTSLGSLQVNPSDIYCYADIPPVCMSSTFISYVATLHVPTTSMVSYFTALYWSNFTNIVADAVEPESLKLSSESIVVEIGSQFSLDALVSPSNATPTSISWESTDTSVAVVTNGTITAVAPGECDIFANCATLRASCHVIVIMPQYGTINLDEHFARILPNHLLTLNAVCSNVFTDLFVSSSDNSIALPRIVNGSIQILGIKEGTAVITVGSIDGAAQSDSCEVVVYTEIGDVNSDGYLNISDVTLLINYLLSGDSTCYNTFNADTNRDGYVNISDVTTLINYLLSGLWPWSSLRSITFIPGETVGDHENVSTGDQMYKDGITISTTYGAFKAAQYRFGTNAVNTFKSDIGPITKIEFTGASSQNPISGFGENAGMTYSGNDGEWNGVSNEVVITTKIKQARASKIVITVSEDSYGKPVFSPSGGIYFEPINVSITCPLADAKIYYTTDCSDPTISSRLYTDSFTLNTNTTIKAISAFNGKMSKVASAEYVFLSERIGLGDLPYIDDNTDVTLGYDATVLHQAGSTMYLKDQTGFGLIYGNTGKTYKKGDVIPAGYGGLKVTYNAELEVKNPVGFNGPNGTATVNTEKITCSQVNHAHWAHYVKIENATLNMTDDNNGTLTDASGSCTVYNKTFGATLPTDGQPHTFICIVASFQPGGQGDVIYQLLPIEVEGVGPGPDPDVIEVGLGQLATVADNKQVKLVHDAVVVWQGGNNNNYLYAKDETGFGLIYGSVGQTYNIGDIIPKNYTGKKTTYKGEPELVNPAGLRPAASNNGITPEVITCEQVKHDNWAHYVLIKNAILNSDTNIYYKLTDDSGCCEVYNQYFTVDLPLDGLAHNWYGIVGVFNNYQFLPVSVDVEPMK